MNDQGATTHDGHGLDTSEQRTGRRTDADVCSLRRTKEEQVGGAAGRTRAFLVTARASSKPCTESCGAENRERYERSVRKQLGSASSSPREILSSSSTSSFYSSKRGRSAFNSSPTVSNHSDPPRYLIRP